MIVKIDKDVARSLTVVAANAGSTPSDVVHAILMNWVNQERPHSVDWAESLGTVINGERMATAAQIVLAGHAHGIADPMKELRASGRLLRDGKHFCVKRVIDGEHRRVYVIRTLEPS